MKRFIGSRKGEDATIGTLATMIIAILVLIAIIGTIVLIASRSDEATQNTLCRASVILRGKATITLMTGVADMEKLTPIVCKTKKLGTLKGDREGIKKQIADRAARCWWQFAEGSVQDIFKVEREEKACFVCYTFTVSGKLDDGTATPIKFLNEPIKRESNNISAPEMINYLASKAYNPAIIYGGGTKNYYGAIYDFKADAGIGDNDRVIKPSKIDAKLASGYIMDYGFTLTQDQKDEIEQAGINLQKGHVANLLLITADEFSAMDPSDARGIIEDAHINTNESTYDALLVMVDLKNHKIRVHVGSDLSVFIKDYDINQILESRFQVAEKTAADCSDSACVKKAIGEATRLSIRDISRKMLGGANAIPGVSPKSYYYYLSNEGQTWPVVDNIRTEHTYVIAYVGVSDERFSATWRPIYKALNFIYDTPDDDPLSFLNWFKQKLTVDRPQMVLITDVNSVGNECTQVV